jgi:hypothetical protein
VLAGRSLELTMSNRCDPQTEPLKKDLAAWRAQTDRAEPTDLIFPSPDGSPWHEDRVRNAVLQRRAERRRQDRESANASSSSDARTCAA